MKTIKQISVKRNSRFVVKPRGHGWIIRERIDRGLGQDRSRMVDYGGIYYDEISANYDCRKLNELD